MLFLIVADRHMGGFVSKDVGGHQDRVVIETHGRSVAIFAGFFLELSHPIEPADPRHAVEHPGQFGMRGNLALVEDDRPHGIDAGGQ